MFTTLAEGCRKLRQVGLLRPDLTIPEHLARHRKIIPAITIAREVLLPRILQAAAELKDCSSALLSQGDALELLTKIFVANGFRATFEAIWVYEHVQFIFAVDWQSSCDSGITSVCKALTEVSRQCSYPTIPELRGTPDEKEQATTIAHEILFPMILQAAARGSSSLEIPFSQFPDWNWAMLIEIFVANGFKDLLSGETSVTKQMGFAISWP